MNPTGDGYYPSFRIRQGSKRDFVGAWIMRLMVPVWGAAIIWMCKMILAGVMYLVNTLPPMQIKVDKLVTDVADLKLAQAAAKKDLETAAQVAKQELIEAEKRVKHEFTEQLKKQSKTKIAN